MGQILALGMANHSRFLKVTLVACQDDRGIAPGVRLDLSAPAHRAASHSRCISDTNRKKHNVEGGMDLCSNEWTDEKLTRKKTKNNKKKQASFKARQVLLYSQKTWSTGYCVVVDRCEFSWSHHFEFHVMLIKCPHLIILCGTQSFQQFILMNVQQIIIYIHLDTYTSLQPQRIWLSQSCSICVHAWEHSHTCLCIHMCVCECCFFWVNIHV